MFSLNLITTSYHISLSLSLNNGRFEDYLDEILLQVGNLQYASPATVSRCGMVFVDPKNLGYEPYWLRWVSALPGENDRKEFQRLYEKYVPQCIALILEGIQDGRQGEKLKTILPITNLNLVMDTWMNGWMDRQMEG